MDAPHRIGPEGDFAAPAPAAAAHRAPLGERATFLVHRINAQLIQICNPVIAPHGLDLYSSRILVALDEQQSMTVGALVELMALPQSTISHQLKRLDRAGYLCRTRSLRDNRSVEVALTDRGRQVVRHCNALSDAVLARVRAALGEDGTAELAALLRRMFESLPVPGEMAPPDR